MREEEVWRLPGTARGRDVRLPSGGGSPNPPSPAAKARLRRIVARAPECVVKVTGRSRGQAGHLKSHLDYITRNGRLVFEDQDGARLAGRDAVRAVHDDWLMANAALARGRGGNGGDAAQSVSLVLSMPPGAPPDRVEAAARSWARETLGGRYDWIMARHDDTGHPHVHVTVRAVGHDGRRLAPGPADLQTWRERFARELRRLGVEAEATPRQARGVVPKRPGGAVARQEARGAEPRARAAARREAEREARGPKPPQPRDWSRDIQARQEAIRRAYLAHADGLEGGDAADRRLAGDIRRFVADMPVPLTRQQALAAELRRVLEAHPGRGRPGPTPAPSERAAPPPPRDLASPERPRPPPAPKGR